MNEKSKKITIISLLSIVIVLLVLLLVGDTKGGKKTIMIYMVGSNLESESAIVTSDLNGIDPKSIDLKNTNVLLYTGGTTKWHNFISNDENAIYILKKSGFQKIESYDKLNMGSSDTLSSFLNYGYDNYKADTYNLILYNHGGAIDGAIYDDFTNDNLSLNDFSKALEDSKFSSQNKLDVVLFRTCLNGTIEVANIFKDYANYLVASEEISYGASGFSVLNFINEVNNKTGTEYGKEFIKSYEGFIKEIDTFGFNNVTYSIVDLSKVNKVNELLDKFIDGINLNTSFREILKERANLFQYASEASSIYDTVDLYTLIDKLGKYSSNSNELLLKAIDDAIVYNYSSDTNNSHGLSIYFPFNGGENYQKMFLGIYESLNYSKSYKNFIQNISNLKNGSSSSSAFLNQNLNDNVTKNKEKEINITLDEEMIKDYSATICNIYIKAKDYLPTMVAEDDIYHIIYSTSNVTLTNNILSLTLDDNFVEIYDDSGNNGYLTVIERAGVGSQPERVFGAMGRLGKLPDTIYAKFYFEYKDNVPSIRLATLREESETDAKMQGNILNVNDYSDIYFNIYAYRFNDSVDGEYILKYMATWHEEVPKLKLRKAGFYHDVDYYAQFHIQDIYGNVQSTKLVKINK